MPKYTHGYINRHGKPCFYLRRPGHKKVRLPGLPWSPEFMQARELALQGNGGKIEIGASQTIAGTVGAALVSYYQSPTPAMALPTARSSPAASSWKHSAPFMATSVSR
jgi:hypothetical protein